MSRLSLAGLVQVGVPPRVDDSGPLSFAEGLILVAAMATMIWLSVRVVAWFDVRFASWELLREIRRELRKHSPRSS